MYVAPSPTPEQIENGNRLGYDPSDCCGSLPYWDFAPDDTLAAACVIHDELVLRGGSRTTGIKVARGFARDAMILAKAVEEPLKKAFEIGKAKFCAEVVLWLLKDYWHKEDWNTDITRAQGLAQIKGAQDWINQCAVKIGVTQPYGAQAVSK